MMSLVACRININGPDPITQSINEPFATDPNRNYRILSVTLPGIPFENIKIDQQKRTIRIKVPTDFAGGELKPVVTLTENTTLLSGLGQRNPFRMESFCYCNQGELVTIGPIGSTPFETPIQYGIVAEASAPLELKPSQTPLVIRLGEFLPVSLPVQNPYGNLPIVKAYVQRPEGGTLVLVHGVDNNSNSCVWFPCDYKQPSALLFTINLRSNSTLGPGTYKLILEQQGGRLLTLSQPLQLVRGEPRLNDNPFFGYTIVQGQSDLLIQGYNLYTDEITGIITDQNGKTWPVRPIAAAPNSTTLSLSIPLDLSVGYYKLQLFKNGIALPACQRLSVRQSDRHPVIYSLLYSINCLATQPVSLRRGVRQSVVISYFNSRSTLKFTNTAKPDEFYQVSIVQPIESFPQITLPQTIPVGTYRVTLLSEDRGQSYESEPFEQSIIVQ